MPQHDANHEPQARNPYQAPQTRDLVATAQQQPEPPPLAMFWQGETLWTTSPAALPPTCVLCNQPVAPRSYQTRQLGYFNPWLYLLSPLVPIFLFVMIVNHRYCNVKFGYCPAHQRRRFWLNALCIACFVLGMGWGYWSFRQSDYIKFNTFVPTYILLSSCFLAKIFLHRLVARACVEDQYGIRGFGRKFLEANLPPMDSPSLTA